MLRFLMSNRKPPLPAHPPVMNQLNGGCNEDDFYYLDDEYQDFGYEDQYSTQNSQAGIPTASQTPAHQQFLRNQMVLRQAQQIQLEQRAANRSLLVQSVQSTGRSAPMNNYRLSTDSNVAGTSAPPPAPPTTIHLNRTSQLARVGSANSAVNCNAQPAPSSQQMNQINTQSDHRITDNPALPQSSASMPVASSSNQGSVYNALKNAISGHEINVYKAGEAVFNGFKSNIKSCSAEVTRFVRQYAKVVLNPVLPHHVPTEKEDTLMHVLYGNTVISMLALERSYTHQFELPETDLFVNVSGAPWRLHGSSYRYPSQPPFSGELIDTSCLKTSTTLLPRILLKKNLFIVLAKACTRQEDIQAHWKLPVPRKNIASELGQNLPNNKRARATEIFPASLVADLKEIFLIFYNLHHIELDVETYLPEFDQLPWLVTLSCRDEKMEMFYKLRRARLLYQNGLFETQLSAALTDLRTATFTEAASDAEHGTFRLRKRARASDHVPADCQNENSPSESAAPTTSSSTSPQI